MIIPTILCAQKYICTNQVNFNSEYKIIFLLCFVYSMFNVQYTVHHTYHQLEYIVLVFLLLLFCFVFFFVLLLLLFHSRSFAFCSVTPNKKNWRKIETIHKNAIVFLLCMFDAFSLTIYYFFYAKSLLFSRFNVYT